MATNTKQSASVARRASVEPLELRLLMAIQPVISEFMADNASTIKDPGGNYSDWVEVYNPDPAERDLGGYFLTDDASKLTKWEVPAGTTIPAGGYLLVWANSTGTPNPGRPLYANFALSKNGEYLGLVEPDGVTVDSQYSPGFPPQQEDKSYGLAGTNIADPTYGKLAAPTPGAENVASVQVADVQFSVQRGFFSSAFTVALSTPTSDATIRYTLDDSTPTSSSTRYTGPITISKTTVVRAVAFKTGAETSVVASQTYIFLDQVIRQPKNLAGFPTTSKQINNHGPYVPQDTAMDQKVVSGNEATIKAGLQSIPTLSLSADFNKLFGTNGVYDQPEGKQTPEQPISIELIDPAHPESNSGVYGIAEGQSHDRMKRSLRLSFKGDYGGPTKWVTDLLKNGPVNGDSAQSELDNLVLRAGNNRNWARANYPTAYTEDEWYRATQVAASGEGSHGTFVHLYINGAYWGLYNVAERPDEKRYAEANGIDDETAFSINQDGEVKGDATRWNYLLNTVANRDTSTAANWADFQKYVDVKQFAEYLLVSWYQGQTDWPDNNWYAAGPADGKFRFYAWDGEKSWDLKEGVTSGGAYIEKQFTSTVSTSVPIIKIFRAAMKSREFKTLLADAAYRLVGNDGPLSDAASQARWDTLTSFVSGAVWGESARWGDIAKSVTGTTFTKSKDWTPEVSKIRGQMAGNGNRLLGLMKARGWYPSLSAPTFAERGGEEDPGFRMVLSNPNASSTKLYYTLDGTDPRAAGDGLSPSAKLYAGPVTLNATTSVVIRVLSGTSTWSARDQATFTIDPFSKLRVVEMMYNPAGPAKGTTDVQDMEFIEVQNVGTGSIPLNGVKFDTGITFTFPDVSLAPGAFAVVAKNATAYAARYPDAPAPIGTYTGSLDNGGEEIRLTDPFGVVIQDFRYEDGNNAAEVAAGWLPSTDGGGFLMTIINPLADPASWNLGTSWRASDAAGGTPGASNVPAPVNQAPRIAASGPGTIYLPETAPLRAVVTDDDFPEHPVTVTWSQFSGPGTATFSPASGTSTSVAFSATGTYVLRAVADDGQYQDRSDVTVVVNLNPAREDVTFNPTADAYVHAASTNANFGSSPTLLVKQATTSTDRREGLLKFDVSSFTPDIGSVKLRLFGHLLDNRLPSLDTQVFATGTSWKETAVTWDTRPANNGSALGVVTVTGTAGGWVELDVTAFVKAERAAGRNVVAFLLRNPTASSPYNIFNSREATTNRPELVVTPSAPTPNKAPTVSAGPDRTLTLPSNTLTLNGSVADDGKPLGTAVASSWSVVSGPGTVQFGTPTSPVTGATFSAAGTYVLRLTASDTQYQASDDVTVTVSALTNAITQFLLLDAATGNVLRELKSGDVLSAAELPAKVNVRAVESGAEVKSVRFAYDATPGTVNSNYRTDTSSAFTLFAQTAGGGTFALGDHTLNATPFTSAPPSGAGGKSLQAVFSVVETAAGT